MRDGSKLDPEPDACLLCGWPERGHAIFYFAGHVDDPRRTYVAPDDATRLARMKQRRARRDAAA